MDAGRATSARRHCETLGCGSENAPERAEGRSRGFRRFATNVLVSATRIGQYLWMGWSRGRRVVFALLVLSMSGAAPAFAASSSVSLAGGLVDTADLPGGWSPYQSPPAVATGHDLCGRVVLNPVTPVESSSAAWTVTPDNGPIFGERIERYASTAAAKKAVARVRALPSSCSWADSTSGARWRTQKLSDPKVGGDGCVMLVTSRDRSDSYNYEVVVRSNDIVLHAVLNSRIANRAEVDQLLRIAWNKARTSGLVSS
jgi:hypothetical protein